MKRLLNNFYKEETGAVTVDWVVLTAAIVGLGIGVIALLVGPTENIASKISDAIGSMEVNASSDS